MWLLIIGILYLSSTAKIHGGKVQSSPSSNNGKSRCLIVTIDNRDLQPGYHDQHYLSMTSVINHAYATYQGYDFYYLQNDVNDLVTDVLKKYPHAKQDPMMLDGKHVAKDVATGFHVGLQQFRAASWAKLPALWYVTKKFGHKYDYIWYIDSDATVSPFFFNRSIDDAISYWQQRQQQYQDMILLGNRDIMKSKLLFFSNFPWRDNMPCAGSFIFRPRHHTESIFREWWDYNLESKNFKHFHEQDALWHMIEHEQEQGASSDRDFRQAWQSHFHDAKRFANVSTSVTVSAISAPSINHRFRINNDTFSVVKEQQFPSSWTRYEDSLWLTHIASYNYAARMPILYQFLQKIDVHHEENYRESIEHITHRHRLLIKPLEIAEMMEEMSQREDTKALQMYLQIQHSHANNSAASVSAKARVVSSKTHASSAYLRPRVTLWPVHDEENQQKWYDEHVSSKAVPTLPLSVLYEGRLIRKKNEFWIVHEGKKYGFPSFDVFLQCHFFVDDVAFPLYASEISKIPDHELERLLPKTVCQGIKPYIDQKLKRLMPSAKNNHNQMKDPAHQAMVRKYIREIDWSDFDQHELIDPLCRKITRLYRPIPKQLTNSSSNDNSQADNATMGQQKQQRACDYDEELHRLVQTTGTRSRLFIVAHNEESRQLAQDFVTCHQQQQLSSGQETTSSLSPSAATSSLQKGVSWMQVMFIPSTVFFESMIYNAQFIPSIVASNGTLPSPASSTAKSSSLFSSYVPSSSSPPDSNLNSSSIDYVITATYKTVAKNLHYNGFSQSMEMIYGHLKIAKHYNYDVVPFLRSGSDFITFVRYWHGDEYVQAWNALLLALGYTEVQIRAFDRTKVCFYRNIFIMKTSVFLRVSALMQRAMDAASHNPVVQQLLAKNAKYKEGQEEVAKRIFGTTYYQLHPFIFERLPSFFVYTEGFKVCIGDKSPCKYNS